MPPRGGSRWFVDETYVKVAGVWRYVYRAVDEHGQVLDVYVSARRDITAATPVLAVDDRDPWPPPRRSPPIGRPRSRT